MRRLHDTLGLKRVINARGTYTPLGVSRSPEPVIEASAEAMRHYFDMADLRRAFGEQAAALTGADWGGVTHCTAASITMACAAVMTGNDADKIARLPDTNGMTSTFVIQAGHVVNYGHNIIQAIRLSGADVVVAGNDEECTPEDLEQALSGDGIAGLVMVRSRLCRGNMVAPGTAMDLAHELELPVILDAAAQDLIMEDMLALGAGLTLFSAQKYLAAPTSGLVLGKRDLVENTLLQETGIGRAMKAGKEAIIGAYKSLELRSKADSAKWIDEQRRKSEHLAGYISRLGPLSAETVPDPVGNPFSRVRVFVDTEACGKTASAIAERLAASDPAVIVQDHDDAENSLMFEAVALDDQDIEIIVSLLAVIVFNRPPGGMRKRNIEDW